MNGRILFLCSGNYYRSRFAEILFNHLAAENDLEWDADSRGIVAEASRNPGPISQATLDGLAARNIPVGAVRFPMQLTEQDLERADRVIALYDDEHRPMLRRDFPRHVQSVEFWRVPDLDEMSSDEALSLIEENVRTLIQELQQEPIMF